MSRSVALATCLLLATSLPALAHPSAPGIDKRQSSQTGQIVAGRKDGSLTWYEKWVLRKEQRRIYRLEAKAKSDGKLSRTEIRSLSGALDDAGRHIYQQRHDGEVRGWWWRTFVR